MSARWWSQPYPPDGTVASEGIRRQLGTPELDPLIVLLRETSQNSWDARTSEHGSVSVAYRLETLDEERLRAFSALLLPGPFDSFDVAMGERPMLLVVSDRCTSGLGGSIRSDDAVGDASPDFVNLVRNVGEPRDRRFGGGTYGFGKGSLFRSSRASAVLVDTLCRSGGRSERRLIAAALGPTFERNGKRYTGRHWWGHVAEDGVVDPLLDAEADAAATALGLHGFAEGETGTDLYVVCPDLGVEEDFSPRSPRRAALLLAGTAAWYLWPKLVGRRGQAPRMRVAVSLDGEDVPVPDPARSGPLRPFVRALAELDAGRGTPMTRRTPPREVGHFAVVDDVYVSRADEALAVAQPFAGPAHHCARMRHVELIVDYLEGPPPSDVDTQYGAVFRASDAAEDHFAAAEPPTHDAWVHQHLSGAAKGVVQGAQTFVRTRLNDHLAPAQERAGGAEVPLGRLSSALAKLLPGSAGDGGSGDSNGEGGGGGGGGGGAGSPFATEAPRLEVHNGRAVVVQRVRATVDVDLRLRAEAHVAVDGGRERVAPSGGEQPHVLGWRTSTGRAVNGEVLDLAADDSDRVWEVVVLPAPDTSTSLVVRQVSGGGE